MQRKLELTKGELVRVLEEIRTFVNSADHSNSPEAAKLAQQYAAACRYANDRLERCGGLIAKGHRPEAISLSQAEPDLLQLVASLTFPEMDLWQEIASTYGWDRAPALKAEIAGTINDGYATEERLSGLLNANRALAMREAPVHQRLTLLRQIASEDVTTPFWRDDVATFERQFANEMASFGQSLVQTQDIKAIEGFVARYEQEPWVTTPPEAARTVFRRAVEQVSFQRTLPNLVSEFENAHSVQAWSQLQKTRESWNRAVERLTNVGCTRIPDAYLHRVRPIIQRMDQEAERAQQTAFANDVRALLIAIQQGEPPEKIEVLVAAADSHGIPIPNTVVAEIAAYRRQEIRGTAISTFLVIISIVAVAVFIGLIFLLFQMSKS